MWLALAAITALLCLGGATPLGTLFFYAPGYASFRAPARHLFVVSLCLAVGSGLTFSELTRSRNSHGLAAAAVAVPTLRAARSDVRSTVVLANREFEAWFLASLESLRGVRGVSMDAAAPSEPDTIRGAKERLSSAMSRPYATIGDQAAFAARFDMGVAEQRSRSFRKLMKELRALLA